MNQLTTSALEHVQRKKQDCTVGDRGELPLQKATIRFANYNTQNYNFSLSQQKQYIYTTSSVWSIPYIISNVHLSNTIF